jgi:hypothetical protein
MTDLPAADQPASPVERVEELVQRTHRAVLGNMEELLKRQLEPLFLQARQTLRDGFQEVVDTHAEALLLRLKQVTLETAGDLLNKEVEPFLERTRQMVLNGLTHPELVEKTVDRAVQRLRTFVIKAVQEVERGQLPEQARRFGRRVVDYAVGVVLLCLAVVLLLLGGVLGLQQAGVPTYATYLAGGLGAAVAAFFLFKIHSRNQGPSSALPAGISNQEAEGKKPDLP